MPTYNYKGKTQTLPAWASELNVSVGAIHYRLANGWSFQEVMETPFTRGARNFTHDGKTQNLTDWASELGVSPTAISIRMKGGMTFEEAISQPFRHVQKNGRAA